MIAPSKLFAKTGAMFLQHKRQFSEAEKAMDQNDLETADDILSEILKSNSDVIEALFNRALIRQRLKKTEEALVDINRLIQLRPENALALMLKGEILLEANRFAEAYESLLASVRIEKDNGRTYCSLGRAAAALGKPLEAVEYFEQALQFEQQYTLATFMADYWAKN